MCQLPHPTAQMDVRCTPPCASDRLGKQAQIYGSILQACLNNTNCKSFETWCVK